MNRSIVELIAVMAGVAGMAIAASLVGVLTNLPTSILMGSSVGIIVWSIASARGSGSKSADEAKLPLQLRQERVRQPVAKEELPKNDAEALKDFDIALASLKRTKNGIDETVVSKIDREISRLGAEYPEYAGEARVRSYLLLKRISDTLDKSNADSYMGLTYRLLRTRREEAAEYTRSLLNGRVEEMYLDPEFENSRYLAGTLIMLNKSEKEYVKKIILDAIHLWSEPRFEALKSELGLLRMLEEQDRAAVAQLVRNESRKAAVANEPQVALRAREIMDILSSRGNDPQIAHT